MAPCPMICICACVRSCMAKPWHLNSSLASNISCCSALGMYWRAAYQRHLTCCQEAIAIAALSPFPAA